MEARDSYDDRLMTGYYNSNPRYGNQRYRDTSSRDFDLASYDSDSDDMLDYRGEITGEFADDDLSMAKGMPMRSLGEMRAPKNSHYDPYRSGTNPTLDFDLYDHHHKPKTNVSYHDPYSFQPGTDTQFSGLGEKQGGSGPGQTVALAATSYASFFEEVYDHFMQSQPILLSPFSLYHGLFFLYLASDDPYLAKLLRIDGVPKELAYREVGQQIVQMQARNKRFPLDNNLLIYPQKLQMNQHFSNVARRFMGLYAYRNNSSDEPALENMIKGVTRNLVRETVSAKVLSSGQLVIHSSSAFDMVLPKSSLEGGMRAFSGRNRQVRMMSVDIDEIGYVADNQSAIIEIPIDSNLAFGIYYDKSRGELETPSNDYLASMIQSISKTHVSRLLIPQIDKLSRVDYRKFLQNMGLHHMFSDFSMQKLFSSSEPIGISRYYQTVRIKMLPSTARPSPMVTGSARGLNLMVNSPFIYWIRDVSNGFMITMGYFT